MVLFFSLNDPAIPLMSSLGYSNVTVLASMRLSTARIAQRESVTNQCLALPANYANSKNLSVKQDERLSLAINPYGPIGGIMSNLITTQLTEQEVKELLKELQQERVEDLPKLLDETVKVDFSDKMLTELDKNGEVLAIWF